MDLSDIVSAHSALDSLAEARRNFAATLLSEQQQFVASRDFLAERRREMSETREELSLARAELERRGAELQERERGLAQREAAIDASGTAEQLQQQLADLRAELDRDRAAHEREREEQSLHWHRKMAEAEESIRSMTERIHELDEENERLRKELDDAATRREQEQTISRNSALEFERLVNLARKERDDAVARQVEAEENAKKSWKAAKKHEDSRDEFKNKADVLATELSKANSKLKVGLEELEKVQAWVAKAMQNLHLVPLPLPERSISGISTFFSDLSGQLMGLPDVLAVRAQREGRQIIDAIARLILPRVRHLAPDFPFDALLDEFETQEEEDEATAAVEPAIQKLKDAAKRE